MSGRRLTKAAMARGIDEIGQADDRVGPRVQRDQTGPN